MMRKIATFIIAILATVAASQPVITPPPFNPLVGVLPVYNDANWNWQMAGLQSIGGIPNRTTQCGATVTTSGLTPPQAGDDASKINAAITACPDNQVVVLGTGTFQLDVSQSINLTKDVTLRGSGTASACTTGPCWPTIISYLNGAWNTYTQQAGTAQCGTTTGVPPGGSAPPSLVSCGFTQGPIVSMKPPGLVGQNASWANCLTFTDNPTTKNCGATLAADVAQGATTVQVSSTTNFSVGMWVLIDESAQTVSTANPVGNGQPSIQASAEFLNTSGSPAVFRVAAADGNCNYNLCPDRLNAEIHLVASIGAGPCPGANCTLTFDSPLTIAFRQSGSHDARVYWPTANGNATPTVPFLQKAGIENLTIERATNSPLQMFFCAYCWAKNVEAAYWIKGAGAVYSARVEFTGSYLHDCIDCVNDGNEYPISIDTATTEALVDNNIILRAGKGMVGRTANSAVVSYNYEDMTFYEAAVIGDYFHDVGINGSHNAGTHHFLLEGNRGHNCGDDSTHGSAFYHTYFRNHCAANRTPFVDPSNPNGLTNFTVTDTSATGGWAANPMTFIQPQPIRGAGPDVFDYWMAYVGNVLGTSGTTTAGNGFVYESTSGAKEMWISGADLSGRWGNFPDPNLTGASHRFIHRHRNYDYVTPGIANTESGFSTALPNSFYLAQKPAYFNAGAACTYPWPWVTPDQGTQIQSATGPGACTTYSGLPAKARWDAGTPFAQP